MKVAGFVCFYFCMVTCWLRLAMPTTMALVFCACGESEPPPKSPSQITAEYRDKLDHVEAEEKAKMVWPTCENPPPGKRCGLLWNEMINGIVNYVHDVCGEDPPDQHLSDSCGQKFYNDFIARLPKWYPDAKPRDIDAHCTSMPSDCSTPLAVEAQWLFSHNHAVEERMERRMIELEQQHERAQDRAEAIRQQREEDAERRIAAIRAIGSGLQAAAAGLSSGGSSPPATSYYQSPATAGCTSDYACGIGFECVKPQFSSTGTCARTVTPMGMPVYSQPRPYSVGPGGPGACSFDTDCPVTWKCIKGGALTGHCMK